MKTMLNRRHFLGLTAGTVAGTLTTSAPVSAAVATGGIQAVAFDAFPIFDPRPSSALVEQFFPGKGAELSNAWRTRQFEYTWLRTVAGRYADFWQVTEEALTFAARALKLELDSQRRARLMNAYP